MLHTTSYPLLLLSAILLSYTVLERLSNYRRCLFFLFFFFFNDTATTEIYTLSLHDALPISWRTTTLGTYEGVHAYRDALDEIRKSTRLNSSHTVISYAVFCLKKKK